ncbi:BamA/TamA family outer membrane protein [Spirosoma montaniterrae]|nr:BamA/TamA family outer membrane protein [Spirosoma montaniterrae]
MKSIQLTLLIIGLFGITANAQDTTVAVGKKEKKFTIIPMPVIAGNPTTGLMLGVSPGVSFINGNPETTSISNFLGAFIYTTKKQLLTSVRGSLFTEGDKWVFTTDIRFNINSQPTYGLSTRSESADNTIIGRQDDGTIDNLFGGPTREEMMGFNHFRLYQTVLKRYKDSRLFYGAGYHLDNISKIDDNQLDLTATPQLLTHHYRYQTIKNLPLNGYTQSGVSLNVSFDSRDNIANPYKGRLASASFRINPSFLGSTAPSSQLWLEYRDYIHLNKARPRNLIAFWTYGWFVTGGDVPYMFLPAVGWDMFSRSGRPYTQGRFRGEDLSYTEAEWRFPLQRVKNKIGGVVFINMTSASSRTENIGLFSSAQFGYGAGFRYMLSEKNRVNLGIDYGIGRNGASGLFLNLNEYF